jgi:co-chaperonin GroES (HSP10)
MIPLNNLVAVKGISHDDSMMDVSYDEQKHFNLYYTVVGIGKIGRMEIELAAWYEVEQQVKVGDRILVRWYDVEEAYKRKDSDGVFLLHYSGIVAIERDGKLIPVNDNVLFEADEVSHTTIGQVTSIGDDIINYMSYEGNLFKPTKVEVGDWIQTERFTGREIEHLFHQKNDRKLFAVQAKDILVISKSKIYGELQ